MILVSFMVDKANIVLDNMIYIKERRDDVNLYLPRQPGVVLRAAFLCAKISACYL